MCKVCVGKDQQNVFENMKQAIPQPPVSRMANFSKTFILQTDATGVALGGGAFTRE